jgi:hypothetical protein
MSSIAHRGDAWQQIIIIVIKASQSNDRAATGTAANRIKQERGARKAVECIVSPIRTMNILQLEASRIKKR